jgi:hypothetical protein
MEDNHFDKIADIYHERFFCSDEPFEPMVPIKPEQDRSVEIRFGSGIYSIIPDASISDADIQDLLSRLWTYLVRERTSADDYTFIYCLVGNIVDRHVAGSTLGVRRGTKQFAPGAKVYCFPPTSGGDRIQVIGKPRKKKGLITVYMRPEFIKNWRLQKVYDSYVITEMFRDFGWTDSEEDKHRIESLLQTLASKTVEELPNGDED